MFTYSTIPVPNLSGLFDLWKPKCCGSLMITCHYKSISCKRMFCSLIKILESRGVRDEAIWELASLLIGWLTDRVTNKKASDEYKISANFHLTENGVYLLKDEQICRIWQFFCPVMKHLRHSLKLMFLHTSRWPALCRNFHSALLKVSVWKEGKEEILEEDTHIHCLFGVNFQEICLH